MIEANIIVDAVIVGGSDTDHVNLRSLAHCSGGLCFRIPAYEEGLSKVFEREKILSLSARILRPPIAKGELNAEVKKRR